MSRFNALGRLNALGRPSRTYGDWLSDQVAAAQKDVQSAEQTAQQAEKQAQQAAQQAGTVIGTVTGGAPVHQQNSPAPSSDGASSTMSLSTLGLIGLASGGLIFWWKRRK